MKHLQDTPWWICDSEDTNYCSYVDTDSNYFHAEPILRHLNSNFDEMSDKEKDNALEDIALKYQDIITDHYDILAKEAFNVYKFPWFEDRERDHWLEMKTECVIRSAYFRNTRRYAQWITKQEGIEKETLDIKGLEFKKANFPPLLGEFFQKALIDVLKGAKQSEIDKRLEIFKTKILDGTIPLTKLGNPTAIKQLNKHQGPPARAGEMFSKLNTVYSKKEGKEKNKVGAPASVRAAIKYNDLIRFWKLNNKHSYISQADKVKWVYLKPNPYQIEALAFFEFDMPEKIRIFLEEYADRKKIFDSILLNKLEGFYSDLGWVLNLNPYKKQLFNI
jgi:DNA polymerase elongation subunit (family B)